MSTRWAGVSREMSFDRAGKKKNQANPTSLVCRKLHLLARTDYGAALLPIAAVNFTGQKCIPSSKGSSQPRCTAAASQGLSKSSVVDAAAIRFISAALLAAAG